MAKPQPADCRFFATSVNHMAIELIRTQVDAAIVQFLEQMGEKNRLREACEYALLNGGKRLRPILVLLVAEAIGRENVMPAALSVECFHTASLIADDLPCMDDDEERRSKASLHKVFGESTAILASYALIAEGYGNLYRQNSPEKLPLCLEAATRCAGISGATCGQFLDLNPPDCSLATIEKIIYQQTITLFEISFVFGWAFGGGDLSKLELVERCAYHFGMAFQIADDLIDQGESSPLNYAGALGQEAAERRFERELESFCESLRALGLFSEKFQEVVGYLQGYSRVKI